MSEWYRWQDSQLILSVIVQPNSAKDQLVGIHDSSLKIKISAPAVDNKANTAVCRYLATLCEVSKSKVQLLSGHTQRNKRIQITLNEAILPAALLKI